jgi:type III pantothenate kinase
LANASAAEARYGAPVIVADFGTALTFDVVSAEGAYVGGAIAPGLPLMVDYLAEKTALLPRIRLTGRCAGVGRSTPGAMRIGARIGYRGIVREIVGYLTDSMGGKKPRLCATGGYARWALAGLDLPFEFDRNLTFHGLIRIYGLNTGG